MTTATCRKTIGEWFAVIVTTDNQGSHIYTLRGPYKTRKCALAEAKKNKRRIGKDAIIDVMKKNMIQAYMKQK